MTQFENNTLDDYNCGGYAFETYEWYEGVDSDEVARWIFDLFCDGDMSYEIGINLVVFIISYYIMKDFKDRQIHIVENFDDAAEDEYVVALRIGISNAADALKWESSEDVDYDFHFLKYKNESFTEKCGKKKPAPVDHTIYLNWEINDFVYDSQMILFALKN